MREMKFAEPDAEVIRKYKAKAENRDDYDGNNLVLFAIMMWASAERIAQKVQARFGSDGWRACRDAAIGVGAEAGKRYVESLRPNSNLSDVEMATGLCWKAAEVLGALVKTYSIGGNGDSFLSIGYCPLENSQLTLDCLTKQHWIQGFLDAGCKKLGIGEFGISIDASEYPSGRGLKYVISRTTSKEIWPGKMETEAGARPAEELRQLSGAPESQPRKKSLQGKHYRVPYARTLDALRKKALSQDGYDVGRLVTCCREIGRVVLELFRSLEESLGKPGQDACSEAMVEVGYEIGTQVLFDRQFSAQERTIENLANYVSWLNYYPYASPEIERIDDENSYTLDVHWCPVQDIYKAFDCRVMRYLMEGHLKAAYEHGLDHYDMRCIRTMPDGADSCQFAMWGVGPEAKNAWFDYTTWINEKALKHAASRKKAERN